MKKATSCAEMNFLSSCEGILTLSAKDVLERLDDNFIFSDADNNINKVIINGCRADFPYDLFFNFIAKGVEVEKQGMKLFIINPHFVFVATEYPNLSGASFEARFEIESPNKKVKRNLSELQKNPSITVADLREGMQFKLLGQRKWRKAAKIIHYLPHPHKDCTLIILDNGKCSQMVLYPEVEILINADQTSN
jgi:hypothetical protein